MSRSRTISSGILALVLPVLVSMFSRSVYAQDHAHEQGDMHKSEIRIPASIKVEHGEIHEALVRATEAPGEVGKAARDLAAVLHPHFVREEQIALPPLGLLAQVARGEVTPEMRAVLPMTDSLRAELPEMLEEHKTIHAATVHLGEVAKAAGDSAVARLAEQLLIHAQNEEEVMYPAAILVGDVVRARLR
ncbi:MAG TPA: hemerythrin domain-containing protein [Gemmatimonadaceae bacterium]|nr:hemerythrin domain-containing protein [Gemmatimonadaceae bacterium]